MGQEIVHRGGAKTLLVQSGLPLLALGGRRPGEGAGSWRASWPMSRLSYL
jgi:hypothetical protein